MLKLLRNKTRNLVSISIKYYFILIILAMALIVISQKTTMKDLLVNLGYGIIASTIVAFLVDYAAIKRQREKDHKNYKIMVMSLTMSINKLISIRHMLNDDFDQSYRNLPYSRWINAMRADEFQNTPLRGKQVFEMHFSTCKDILREARYLNYYIGILIDNQFAGKDFVKSLKNLISCFEEYVDSQKNDYAHTLDIMKAISSLFPEYSEILLKDWSEAKAKPFVD